MRFFYGLWLIVYIVLALIYGWQDPINATRTLEAATIKPVQVGGIAWFACGAGDWYATRFVGTNSAGQTVSGEVCGGLLFKGSTVRFN